MDVVKNNIERLGGIVYINSQKNVGTTVIIKIPLTLSIIDGLLFEVADTKYIVNLNSIEECIKNNDNSFSFKENKIIFFRNEYIKLVDLRETFEVNHDNYNKKTNYYNEYKFK